MGGKLRLFDALCRRFSERGVIWLGLGNVSKKMEALIFMRLAHFLVFCLLENNEH